MKAGVLFSGGKDSALAALMLARDYDVELNTFVFDSERSMNSVVDAAESLKMPLKIRLFPDALLQRAAEEIIRDGFPNSAINMVHLEALRNIAGDYKVIGDGTRFNDRVPMLGRDEVQRLCDRYSVSYVRPLLGYMKNEIDRLAGRYLVISYGETGEIENGDYEREIRQKIRSLGREPEEYFPDMHKQSLVVGIN